MEYKLFENQGNLPLVLTLVSKVGTLWFAGLILLLTDTLSIAYDPV